MISTVLSILKLWAFLFAVAALAFLLSEGSMGQLVEIQTNWFYFLKELLRISFLGSLVLSYHYAIFERYATSKKIAQYFLWLFLGVVATVVLSIVFSMILREIEDLEDLITRVRVSTLQSLILIWPFSLIYVYYKNNLAIKQAAVVLEQRHTQSYMQLLKGKLDPHFLYNNLNTIYAAAQEEQAKVTASMLEDLTQLYRYVNEVEKTDNIAIERELSFIHQYISLHTKRFPQSIVQSDIVHDGEPCTIAPLLLLPLIENVFKHSDRQSTLPIIISVRVTHSVLTLHSTNPIVGNTNGHQIGLKNLQERLKLTYAGRYEWLSQQQEGIYTNSMRINLAI